MMLPSRHRPTELVPSQRINKVNTKRYLRDSRGMTYISRGAIPRPDSHRSTLPDTKIHPPSRHPSHPAKTPCHEHATAHTQLQPRGLPHPLVAPPTSSRPTRHPPCSANGQDPPPYLPDRPPNRLLRPSWTQPPHHRFSPPPSLLLPPTPTRSPTRTSPKRRWAARRPGSLMPSRAGRARPSTASSRNCKERSVPSEWGGNEGLYRLTDENDWVRTRTTTELTSTWAGAIATLVGLSHTNKLLEYLIRAVRFSPHTATFSTPPPGFDRGR